jgi:hypothetical protein
MGIAERSSARSPELFCATIFPRKGSRPRSQIHSTGNAGGVAASGTNAGSRRSRFRGETHSEAISCRIKVGGCRERSGSSGAHTGTSFSLEILDGGWRRRGGGRAEACNEEATALWGRLATARATSVGDSRDLIASRHSVHGRTELLMLDAS